MELSQGDGLISSEPSTKGFDLSAGSNWIYPMNYQFRDYQFNIAQNSLFNNTLVCLPTGLGKTLIAAVVMYNFWRWYPQGKIIFLAPTKPLVAQQIIACHDIMGIPSVDTVELTGTMNPKNRQIAWFRKRVIFATPQVFQNDLEKQILSGDTVRCVVIDEAHKALGKHSYCESIRLLQTQNKCFRVLALSATPGSRIEDVCQVMTNLLISNLELRDETSPDIIPYLNKRQMDIILVPLDDDLARFKERYILIMDRYIRLLVQYNVLKGNASTITKGRIFYLYKEFQTKTNKPGNYGQIMKAISRCMSLYHAYDLMIRHGLRAFASFCQSHSTDIWMTDEPALQDLLHEVQTFLGPFPDIHPLPDGTMEEIPKDMVLGHTKFYKLRTLLLEHFEKFAAKNEETRAIVFVEYRDSVNEVYISLLQSCPTIRPKMFVGQAGQKRKQQMQAMEAFRNNEANVLISTSVGEEGLDVGEVDLIVCFDISQSSPIRLVQRMGRTGRRRDGRIVMLVTDGKEHQALKSTIARKDSLNNNVLHSSNIVSALYQESPRMVPPDINPVCSKRFIELQPKTPAEKGKRKRKEVEESRKETNKRSAKVAKTIAVVHNEGEKPNPNLKPTQSSMLKFFKKVIPNDESEKVSTTCTIQVSQEIQPTMQVAQTDALKLFTSDSVAVEFLTLCAIKASKMDGERNKFDLMDETYLAISSHDEMDHFYDYPVPDLDILNCLEFLEERTKSVSPQVVGDDDYDHDDNDVYVPEFNQFNDVEYQDAGKPLAAGKFEYEDLFDDSCESNEIISIDDQRFATSDDNAKKSLKHEEQPEFPRNDKVKKNVERMSPKKTEIRQVELDLVFETNEQHHGKENSFCRVQCFESILDNSSDSDDIPTSQSELDWYIRTKTRRLSPIHNAVSEKRSGVGIEENINKPLTSIASDSKSHNQWNVSPMKSGTWTSSTNSLRKHFGDTKRWTLGSNSNKINRSTGINKPTYSNDRRASFLSGVSSQSTKVNKDRNDSSCFNLSIHKQYSDKGIRFNPETQPQVIVPRKKDPINEKKNFEALLGADDDVIFIGEVDGTSDRNEHRKNSISVRFDDGEGEAVFDKKTSFRDEKKVSQSHNNSSACTITQILELIDNSTPRKINLKKLSKHSQNVSKCDDKTNTSKIVSQKLSSSHFQTSSNDQSIKTDGTVSRYFSQQIEESKNIVVRTKADEPSQDELDLSDVKWEDEFQIEEKVSVNDEVCSRPNAQLNSKLKAYLSSNKEESFKTNSKNSVIFSDNKLRRDKPTIDNCETNLSIKKEESFITNSENSVIFSESHLLRDKSTTDKGETNLLNEREELFESNFSASTIVYESKIEAKKSSPAKMLEFDLGDFEWDSDFETPANPVKSMKMFQKSNETSSPIKSKDKMTSKQLSSKIRESIELPSLVTSSEKKLSVTNRHKKLKPSTSKYDDNSDSEDDDFYKRDGKRKTVDHLPTTNYVMTTNRSPVVSRGSKWINSTKENSNPNTRCIDLSSFSATRKNGDARGVSFSRGVVEDRNKVVSLDRYPSKQKKYRSRNRIRSEFLDYEAEISSNTSCGTSGEDDDLDGFLSHTQDEPETVDMHGHYLQSIKDVQHSHVPNHLKKSVTAVTADELFSQPESQDSSYLRDSFCVSGGEEDFLSNTPEDTSFESTERVLNGKKRRHSTNSRSCGTKRRRVMENSSDSNSSEDEIEKLRKQILDESLNLKRKNNQY